MGVVVRLFCLVILASGIFLGCSVVWYVSAPSVTYPHVIKLNAESAIHVHCDRKFTFQHFLSVKSVIHNFGPRKYVFYFTSGNIIAGRRWVRSVVSGHFETLVETIGDEICSSDELLKRFVMTRLLQDGGLYLGQNTLVTEAGLRFSPAKVRGDAMAVWRGSGEGLVYVPRPLGGAVRRGRALLPLVAPPAVGFHLTTPPCMDISVDTTPEEIRMKDFSARVCVLLEVTPPVFPHNATYTFREMFPLRDLLKARAGRYTGSEKGHSK